MKKLMFLSIVLFSIYSCAKNEVQEDEFLTPVAKEVLKQSDFTSMRQAYQILSIEEKGSIWEAKFRIVLKNDKNNLSEKQYDIIVNINKFLNETTFKKLRTNPEIGENYLKENLENFQKYFSKVELYMLLQSPYFDETFSIKKSILYAEKLSKTEYNNAININENNLVPVNDCECKYDLGCPGSGNTCELDKGKCSHTRDGCGIFGTSSCTGRCYLSPA